MLVVVAVVGVVVVVAVVVLVLVLVLVTQFCCLSQSPGSSGEQAQLAPDGTNLVDRLAVNKPSLRAGHHVDQVTMSMCKVPLVLDGKGLGLS